MIVRTHAEAMDLLFSKVTGDLRVGTPLGLGKPNQLLNLVYDRMKKDPKRKLEIFTALSLDVPSPGSDLERRFLKPFADRHFGENYPSLHYVQDLKNKTIPEHIRVHEFYFQAGPWTSILQAQRDYVSLNYTHVVRSLIEKNVNVVLQLISPRRGNHYSLSCNPDLTLDLVEGLKAQKKPLLTVGVVHPDLPFLGGDAAVEESFFDVILESPEVQQPLFALPRNFIETADHCIGLYASRLMPDDGTLQIGIGSLSDAVVSAFLVRHNENSIYREWVKDSPLENSYDEVFQTGLYGTSEMLMDGFMHLRKAGILKRFICDGDEKARRYLHGAFFLGSKNFYDWLRNLKGEDFDGLSMTRVSKVNDLYDAHEMALRRQRKSARFYNTCMAMDLLGGAVSETLPDGHVISGVGGQYNFVAMAQELAGARSVLMLRSTHLKKGRRESNIVFSQAYLTIPRHLRDVVVTEYGVVFLKGKTDQQVMQSLIEIADAEFQDDLLKTAKKHGKIPKSYQIPAKARDNTPAHLEAKLKEWRMKGYFPKFPFGSDFTPVEERLAEALLYLKAQPPLGLLKTFARGLLVSHQDFQEEMTRMGYDKKLVPKAVVIKKILLGALVRVSSHPV